MKVEWNEYEIFPDGSQAPWVEELNKFKENLDKRKALMEEAETYRKEIK